MQLSNLTPTATRALLEQLGHHPRKKLGQNFLIDTNVVKKSLVLGQVKASDAIVEIGPGLGTLTANLLQAGVTLYAVELDSTLSTHLKNAFAKELAEGLFHLHEGDCVSHPLGALPQDGRPYKIIANMPYAVATPWLEGVLSSPHLPERMVLMLQKEAADRYSAQPGSKQFSPIAIFLDAAFRRVDEHKVSAHCFYPAPKVGSILLHLERRTEPYCYLEQTRTIIRALFGQRRKQVATSTRQLNTHTDLSGWLEQLSDYGLNETARPETIPHAGWLALDKYLHEQLT